MATHTTSVRDYVTLLSKSKLVPADEAEALFALWKDGTGERDDTRVDSFRKFLVARKVLTDYQGHMLQRGHADGFFLWDYRILDRIGKGQMGGVYKAQHALGQTVALKILPASKARDQHLLGRFQREARLLTQLDHPNVVRAYQVGEVGGVHFIAMEHLEGETLDEVISRRKRLPAGEAVRLVRQALDGLQHLHEKRMVHRDLKPANLMLVPAPAPGKPDTTWDATVKILDIGLGRELFAEGTAAADVETQLTVEGAVLGTPDYLAPEQARDARSSDVRADLYSLGCVLYHCLTGRPPFPETNIMTQMLRHATEPPPKLRDALPDAPAGLPEVIDKLLTKDPAARYQTPREVAEALKPFEPADAGKAAVAADVVPAYKQWLELESGMDIVPVVEPPAAAPPSPPPPPPPKAKSGTAPMTAAKPDTASAAAVKPGTAPAKPVPPPPPPPPPATPQAAKPAPPPPPRPKPAPAPVKPPPPPPPPVEDEIDVELVTFPPPAPQPAAQPLPLPELAVQPLPAAPPPARDDRPLWEWNRRDLFMMMTGVVGALAAVGLGYGLAQVARKKDDEGK
jgi:serine/threonine protein kinase